VKLRAARRSRCARVLILGLGVALVGTPARLLAQAGESCPLPVDKQVEAVGAFAKMLPVFRHPRCMNCHGGVDPLSEQHRGVEALDETIDRMGGPEARARYEEQCQMCHDGLPGWTIPGPPVFFIGKTDEELCLQMKTFEPTGESFVEHLDNDHHGIQFIKAGFAGDRALGADGLADFSLVAEPPPGTQAELVEKAKRWTEILGDGYQASKPCGCVVNLEGTFSQTDSSAQTAAIGTIAHDYTITGRLVWEREDEELPSLPSFGDDTPSWFLRPSAGEIAVEVNAEGRGITGGQCVVSGEKTFRLADLPADARANLLLELAADGRYKLSLGVSSRYLLTPVETVCRVMGREVRSSEEWNDVAIAIGRQQGTVSEDGVVGRLDPPIRQGPSVINGSWSFGASR
jgi:hypothetical protein